MRPRQMRQQRIRSQRTGIHAFDADHARIVTHAGMKLAMAYVNPHNLRSTALQQAIGKAAGGLAHIQAAQSRHIQTCVAKRTIEFQAATGDVFGLRVVEHFKLGAVRHVITVFGNPLPRGVGIHSPPHPRRYQPLGLGAGGGKAMFNKKQVSTHVFPTRRFGTALAAAPRSDQ